MESILDFSKPFDIATFDSVVAVLSSSNAAQIMEAQDVLSKFEAAPESFGVVDTILSQSTQMQSKFIALRILDKVILTRWNTIELENQTAIRGFLINLIVQECGSFAQIRQNKSLLTKMDVTLVNIAKKDWPMRWPSFINDISTSAGPDNPMVENNIHILKLVAEEIFECGDRTLTTRWVERRKQHLQNEFRLIMDLLTLVICSDAVDAILLKTALVTLRTYIPWLPPEQVFAAPLLEKLSFLAVGAEDVRIEALQCFTEIGAVAPAKGAAGDSQLQLVVQAFKATFNHIIDALPTTHQSIPFRVAELYETGSAVDRRYLSNLSLLASSFLKHHTNHLAYDERFMQSANEILVGMTSVEDEEIFKTCVEYWWWLGNALVKSKKALPAVQSLYASRLKFVLSDVRFVLVRKMVKPPEITIKEEGGELRCEKFSDLEELEMYKLMKETLFNLSQLDPGDMCNILMNNMLRLLDKSEWSYQNCNSLSWSVGAISMSMSESQESTLFANVIRGLLSLCKEIRDRRSKALVATDIMFVVGEYPRYLRAHRPLLRGILHKLLEFMKETIEGVMQMAVETLERLCVQLADAIVKDFGGEPSFAASIIVPQMGDFMCSLSPSLQEACFRSFGYMVAAAGTVQERRELLAAFLQTTNAEFNAFTAAIAPGGTQFCHNGQNLAVLLHYLRIYCNIASTCGDVFIEEMSLIVSTLHDYYVLFTQYQSEAAQQGARGTENYRTVRLLKKHVLLLFERFVQNTEQLAFVASECMPPIFNVVLADYKNSPPEIRDPGVLDLVTACVTKLGQLLAGEYRAILEHTFLPTVPIFANPDSSAVGADFVPDFRVALFKLLRALNAECFSAYVECIIENQEIMECMLWGVRQCDYATMSPALDLLDNFLGKITDAPFSDSFFSAFMLKILQDVLVCALDKLHTAGFELHSEILRKLFIVSASAPEAAPGMGATVIRAFLMENLAAIPTLANSPDVIASFMMSCYDCRHDAAAFRTILSDFLIEARIWGAQQEEKLEEGFSSLQLSV